MTTARDPSVISSAEAQSRAAAAGGSVDRAMAKLLPGAQALAIAPISGFRVGAVAQGLSGALYLGANLEFSGTPLGASVHAEQAAVANAWAHGETGVVALAVTAAPCGHCRQFLNELVTADRLRILVTGNAATILAALLPAAFGPRDLGIAGGLMRAGADALRSSADSPEGADPVTAAAFAAAGASYAPYSRTFSGVALELADGSILTGRYAENAAFNPSLPPLQGALVRLAMQSIPYDAIRRAVLVEAAGKASQRAATEALLAAIAPKVTLAYVQAELKGLPGATAEESDGLDSTDTPALS